MPLFVAMKCPKCGKSAVFPTTKIMKIDGEMCGPLTVVCKECGWGPSNEDLIDEWRRNHKPIK